MTQPNLSRLLVFFVLLISCSCATLAQQIISDEKKALIREFRELTGALKYQANVSSNSIDFADPFTPIVDKDRELTEAQKLELRKFASEAKGRVDKIIQGFFSDKIYVQQVFEDAALLLYDRTFTESELRESIAFYRTPAGQKAMKFLSNVAKQLTKEFGETIGRKLGEVIAPKLGVEHEELKKRILETKGKTNQPLVGLSLTKLSDIWPKHL